jgi:hypothetical protein
MMKADTLSAREPRRVADGARVRVFDGDVLKGGTN